MWELIVPLWLMTAEPVRPWPKDFDRHPEIVESRDVALGPFPSREACHAERRRLRDRIDRFEGRTGREFSDEPEGFDRLWSYYDQQDIGFCAERPATPVS